MGIRKPRKADFMSSDLHFIQDIHPGDLYVGNEHNRRLAPILVLSKHEYSEKQAFGDWKVKVLAAGIVQEYFVSSAQYIWRGYDLLVRRSM